MFHVKRMASDLFAHLAQQLDELEKHGLRRYPPAPARPGELSFCSNDYLGLAAELAPPAPSGSGASRLIAGERDEHGRLERAFARWLGVEDALVFSSGYAANVGSLAALAAPGDLIVSDALNHASLIDGARLSRARVVVVPHGDLDAIAQALADRAEVRAWVVVESYYSMDADGPDLGALRTLCTGHGAGLYVDEAHALGVLGPGGRGRCAESGITPDVLVGTLGKAFGGQGAFVAGKTVLRDWLWNRARSFVFSTGLAPVSAAAAVRSLQHVIEHPELALRVRELSARLRAGLVAAGARTSVGTSATPRLLGDGHVVPVVLGSPVRALRWAERMRNAQVHVQAIRPPTVPSGSARIRLTVTAQHGPADIDRAIEAFAAAYAVDRHDVAKDHGT
ncbi:MAG: 8-amino-7-oxononanoate synthase [Labilithrix sp.]|nr:8-amino-7-oxononanoate synthase [Labilithrix sp.]